MKRPQTSQAADEKGDGGLSGLDPFGIGEGEDKAAQDKEEIDKQISVPNDEIRIQVPVKRPVVQHAKHCGDAAPAIERPKSHSVRHRLRDHANAIHRSGRCAGID